MICCFKSTIVGLFPFVIEIQKYEHITPVLVIFTQILTTGAIFVNMNFTIYFLKFNNSSSPFLQILKTYKFTCAAGIPYAICTVPIINCYINGYNIDLCIMVHLGT